MNKISPPLIGLALILFLLPWISLSCAGQKVFTFSGTDLAIGHTIEFPNDFGKMQKKNIRAWTATLALLAALVGLIASFVVNEDRPKKIILTVCGGIGGILLFLLRSRLNTEAFKQGEGMVQVDYHFGFWATLLLFFGVAAINVLSLTGYLDNVTGGVENTLPFKSPPKVSFCSQCGARISKEDTFCSECGKSLK